MNETFLIGGGRDADLGRVAHAPFAEAVGDGTVAFVVADEGDGVDSSRWRGLLADAGCASLREVVVAAGRPITRHDVAGCAGVYVSGGLTPLYAELLSGLVLGDDVVYGGFSAGAAIASASAIVGGWRADGRDICSEDASEDLDELTVVDGLARVPFAVDVHATQWGTLTRLVHAVRLGRVESGYAIDEHTCLRVRDGEVVEVVGAGSAYRVARAGEDVTVTVLGA